MHLDPIAIFFIVWGLSGIVFRRWSGRQWVIVREMTKSLSGSTTQRTGEIVSVVIGSFLVVVGILFALVAE